VIRQHLARSSIAQEESGGPHLENPSSVRDANRAARGRKCFRMFVPAFARGTPQQAHAEVDGFMGLDQGRQSRRYRRPAISPAVP